MPITPKIIRICFIIDALEIGGTEKQLVEVINRLDPKKFKVYLVCLRNSKMIENVGSNCTKLILNINGINFGNLVRNINLLKLFLKREQIDIVQTFFPDANILGVISAKVGGVKKIISSRRDMGFWYTKKTLTYLRIINRCVDRFLVNSEAIKEIVIKNEKAPASKIDVIYNGINMANFRPNEIGASNRTKSELGIPADNIVIGLIANLNRRVKRPDVFVKASAIVMRESENTSFLIIGDGYLRNELGELSKKLGMNDNMVFAGLRKDILELLQFIDVGVLTSDSEGFSNAILEYMAAGIPTVATNVGGNRELINQNEDGYLQPPGEPQLIAKSILKLVRDRNLRINMGNKGKEKIYKRFSIETMINNLANYYGNLYEN